MAFHLGLDGKIFFYFKYIFLIRQAPRDVYNFPRGLSYYL